MSVMASQANAENIKDVYFAGGCFWGVEEYFSRIPGVVDVVSGYANGVTQNPTYQEVCSGRTGHVEAVKIEYDPQKVSLKTLTRQLFKIIDPLSVNKQGNDAGTQYRTGIYYTDAADRDILAGVMLSEQQKYSRPLAVEFGPLQNFYPAEDYHQDYLKKNPHGYCHISFDSLKELPVNIDAARYQKPAEKELKERLSPIEYEVTQRSGTEAPFSGKLWNNKDKGIYVDVVTGEPLFLSSDKFDSGTGWPSFTRPVSDDVIKENMDKSHGMTRIEARSRAGNSHLGHIFNDGPRDKEGMRYCINSASLRFIPYDDMDKEGYGDLKSLLDQELFTHSF